MQDLNGIQFMPRFCSFLLHKNCRDVFMCVWLVKWEKEMERIMRSQIKLCNVKNELGITKKHSLWMAMEWQVFKLEQRSKTLQLNAWKIFIENVQFKVDFIHFIRFIYSKGILMKWLEFRMCTMQLILNENVQRNYKVDK